MGGIVVTLCDAVVSFGELLFFVFLDLSILCLEDTFGLMTISLKFFEFLVDVVVADLDLGFDLVGLKCDRLLCTLHLLVESILVAEAVNAVAIFNI